jgi:glucose/arabinose dehydrogenase
MVFYEGADFPDWLGNLLIGGLRSRALVRVGIDADGRAQELERFAMQRRIRDVAVMADGALWVIEDDNPGALIRITP